MYTLKNMLLCVHKSVGICVVNLDTILCFFVHECSVYKKCILLVYSMHVITPAYWYWKGIPVLMPHHCLSYCLPASLASRAG